MSKLLEDPKVAKLVETREKRAVAAFQKRVRDGLKAVKDSGADDEVTIVKQTRHKTVAAVNRVMREAAQPEAAQAEAA